MILFYRRSGEKSSLAKVRRAKENFADSYRRKGGRGDPATPPNLRLANRIAAMTDEEFCREFGAYTYKKIDR